VSQERSRFHDREHKPLIPASWAGISGAIQNNRFPYREAPTACLGFKRGRGWSSISFRQNGFGCFTRRGCGTTWGVAVADD